MHENALDWVRRQADSHGPFVTVVEFGSRDLNGSPRTVIDAASYIGVDIAAGVGVDVVCDARNFRFSRKVDGVVCTEVFEHDEDWPSLVDAATRILSDDGWFIGTAATHGRGPHSAQSAGPLQQGEYYGNVDPGDLHLELSSRFEDVIVEQNGATHDVYWTAYGLRND